MNIQASRTLQKKTQVFDKIEHGLALISDGLSLIMGVNGLEEIQGPRFVDACARLNAQSLAIEKILEPAKDQIKAEALSDEQTLIKGVNYQAEVLHVPKTRMLMDKVKEFLGSTLYQFQETRDEVRISFKIKE